MTASIPNSGSSSPSHSITASSLLPRTPEECLTPRSLGPATDNPALVFPTGFPLDLKCLLEGVSENEGSGTMNSLSGFRSVMRGGCVVKTVDRSEERRLGDLGSKCKQYADVPLHYTTKDHLTLPQHKSLANDEARRCIHKIVLDDFLNSTPTLHLSSREDGDGARMTKRSTQYAEIISQWQFPDRNRQDLLYASNILGTSPDLQIQIPLLPREARHFDEDSIQGFYNSNMTPEGTLVDIHQDNLDVLSICTDWKMWVFFPTTPSNMNLFRREQMSKSFKLNKLRHDLEHGQYAITAEHDSIYIPTGWLHATYALRNSLTIGTVWSSAEGLANTTDRLIAELNPPEVAEFVISSLSELRPFLECLKQAFQHKMFAECRSALQRICFHTRVEQRLRVPLFSLRFENSRKKDNKKIIEEFDKYFECFRVSINHSGESEEYWKCTVDECHCGLLGHVKEERVGQGKDVQNATQDRRRP
ncbi:hypothetical protein P153DRAFT_391413 [Dothidotthia symphoricarpi CBS 119687]|uniref:JmjC domain-containing protein n=1 Tax=Dothidotthia symphoricarpi CBS 119687 TaxID=1392245 RepID=A0A6A5ZWA4_9PLEO|nr:uncharacterized protein P153DRAFT_391413 [Dothidotthia symphoricarpi CBS 119687]KAF2123576.1 hypothetical protein P153DRAFT_391413 [Dothidotthia symphoricarpi CBS 119687]